MGLAQPDDDSKVRQKADSAAGSPESAERRQACRQSEQDHNVSGINKGKAGSAPECLGAKEKLSAGRETLMSPADLSQIMQCICSNSRAPQTTFPPTDELPPQG